MSVRDDLEFWDYGLYVLNREKKTPFRSMGDVFEFATTSFQWCIQIEEEKNNNNDQ